MFCGGSNKSLVSCLHWKWDHSNLMLLNTISSENIVSLCMGGWTSERPHLTTFEVWRQHQQLPLVSDRTSVVIDVWFPFIYKYISRVIKWCPLWITNTNYCVLSNTDLIYYCTSEQDTFITTALSVLPRKVPSRVFPLMDGEARHPKLLWKSSVH